MESIIDRTGDEVVVWLDESDLSKCPVGMGGMDIASGAVEGLSLSNLSRKVHYNLCASCNCFSRYNIIVIKLKRAGNCVAYKVSVGLRQLLAGVVRISGEISEKRLWKLQSSLR